MNNVIWKEILDGNYSVSNTGIIKANDRYVETKTGIRHYKEKVLIPDINKNDGHLRVTLCDKGVSKKYMVHRLVAENFLENPNNYPVINHKDEDPSNNNVDNLEYCTVAYNNAYNNRHQRIGDAEGTTIDVFDENNSYVETHQSLSGFSKKYNIPLTTVWRKFKKGCCINGYYLREAV